jgi:hypothetical protein
MSAVSGGTTPRGRLKLTTLQRAERARSIAAMRAAGETWAAVAEAHGVSTSRARAIAAEVATEPDPAALAALFPTNPMEPVLHALERNAWAERILVAVAEDAEAPAAARVGAVRGAREASADTFAVLLRIGVVHPSHFQRFAQAPRAAVVAEQMVAIARDLFGVEGSNALGQQLRQVLAHSGGYIPHNAPEATAA